MTTNMYTLRYGHYVISLGCDCCHDSYGELTVYKDGIFDAEFECASYIENEEELRGYISQSYPQYDGFILADDCVWY